ncbi:flagellar hook-length control protein FliK [Roseomonas alkaliterrae]|uniref:Flagellar hook-length control protein FliK n=2 Tax=Neoroseomonas alkaliterrae TaxID=1452450 RepID=A0A840Y3G7_9PROT|nr:flagellar hook-length control protein FliK [Neoroseomonas alkaliterrae]
MRQLAPVVVAVAIPGGTARLAVTLEPAELGRVEISVERADGAAEVRILAERPETLALLQRDQRELDRALGQAGIAPEERRLSFALAERGAGDGGAGQPGHRHGEGRRGPLAAAPPEAPAAAGPARRPLSLIDLAI